MHPRRVRLLLTVVALAATVVSAQSRRGYDLAFASAPGTSGGIFLLRADASAPTLVLSEPDVLLTASSWSPDGKRLAYLGLRPEDRGLFVSYGSLPFHFMLYVVNADGTGRARAADVPVEPSFRWSPDSSRLTVSSSYETAPPRDSKAAQSQKALPASIYVVDVASRRMTRLTPNGDNRLPSWSPDGDRVVFSGDADGTGRDIYVIDADGKNMRRLTKAPTIDLAPTWSPKGDLIAYVAVSRPGSDDMGGVMIMRADGSEPRRVLDGLATAATWSPDAASLLVQSTITSVVNVATGARTPFGQGIIDPTYARDGTIVFRVNEAGGTVIAARPGGGADKLAEGLSSFALRP